MTAPTRQQRGEELRATIVRLPVELLAWLRDEANRRGVSVAMVHREALESFRKAQSKRS